MSLMLSDFTVLSAGRLISNVNKWQGKGVFTRMYNI